MQHRHVGKDIGEGIKQLITKNILFAIVCDIFQVCKIMICFFPISYQSLYFSFVLFSLAKFLQIILASGLTKPGSALLLINDSNT